MSKKQVAICLTLIVLTAAFFRLWELESVPPGLYPDEAMNGNNALEALKTVPPTGGFKWFYPENNGREGLFINIQALSIKIFGNYPWALRGVSAAIGILTVLGLFYLARELFRNNRLALFAAFFLATSFWHINFSRIGFRAIMAPMFLVWSFFLLYKIVNQTKKENTKSETPNPKQIQNPNDKNPKPFGILNFKNWNLFRNSDLEIRILAILAGLLFGLGFHTYISFRAAPLLLIFPFIILWRQKQKKLIAWFLLFAFLAGLPLGWYFLNHPQDFFGRTSQISVFSSVSPVKDFGLNVLKTVGMFFVRGDGNWRHNLPNAPELWWPVAILFAVGMAIALRRIFKNFGNWFLFSWLIIMLLPVVISNEGIPHALRAIVAIPPAMLFAATGLNWLVEKISAKYVLREKKMLTALLFIIFAAIGVNTFTQYFIVWAKNKHTYDAFSGRYVEIGNYLNAVPAEIKKIVIVNANGTDVRGLPMPSQTTIFITDTFLPKDRLAKNITYLMPDQIESITCPSSCQIITLETDPLLRKIIKETVPELQLDISKGIEILIK